MHKGESGLVAAFIDILIFYYKIELIDRRLYISSRFFTSIIIFEKWSRLDHQSYFGDFIWQSREINKPNLGRMEN